MILYRNFMIYRYLGGPFELFPSRADRGVAMPLIKYVVDGIARTPTRFVDVTAQSIRNRYFHDSVVIERTTVTLQERGILQVHDIFGLETFFVSGQNRS